MEVTGVAFIMYPVTDIARSVAFYGETLGLPKGSLATDFWVEFEVSGSTFGIASFEQAGSPGSAQSLALEVPDLPAFRNELLERGIESNEPFETQVCWISGLKDPDGNQVWLHQSKSSAS